MVYQWKAGSRFKADPAVAKAIMDELSEQHNLNAAALVDVSRDENAPLHNEFEWDDAIAGEKWREQTARTMMHSITIIDDEKSSEPVRAYFKIEPAQNNYERIEVIYKDEDKREKLLELARKELRAFTAKYKMLKELDGVFQAIQDLEQALNAIGKK